MRVFRDSLDRPVIDRTGIAGLFDIHLEFSASEIAAAGGVDDNAAPSIFTALQDQLGLKLEPQKGQTEVLVIDHAERVPTAN